MSNKRDKTIKNIFGFTFDEDIFTKVSEEEKLEPLISEINLIEDETIKSFTRSLLYKAEDFWHAPNVSEDLSYDVTDTLVEHTRKVVRVANQVGKCYDLNSVEMDIVISSTLLHDITAVKIIDKDFFYDPLHPYTVDRFVNNAYAYDTKYCTDEDSSTVFIDREVEQNILRTIRCHLGHDSPIPETTPITYMDMIVHIADSVANGLEVIYGK